MHKFSDAHAAFRCLTIERVFFVAFFVSHCGFLFGLKELEWGEAERAQALAGLQAATGVACKRGRRSTC